MVNVCVPMGRDQPEGGRRVERAGAGITVGRNASVRTIVRALDRVLNDASYRRRARRLSTEIAAETTPDRAVAEVEALARQSPRHAETTLEPDPTEPAPTPSP